jgi:hypothetical protein
MEERKSIPESAAKLAFYASELNGVMDLIEQAVRMTAKDQRARKAASTKKFLTKWGETKATGFLAINTAQGGRGQPATWRLRARTMTKQWTIYFMH